MEFDFTPEQYALRDAARELFDKESPPSRLRDIYNGADRDDSVWRAIAGMGLLGIEIPEGRGGMGGDLTDLALVLEEAGRAALPEPLLEHAAIAAPALGDEWGARLASGDAIATVLLEGDAYALDADAADVLLLERDGALYAMPAGSFQAKRVASEDRARRLFAITADPANGTGLDASPADARAFAAAGAACMLNGVGLRLLDITVAYVRDRIQFDRPVGSFQAVKHPLADAHVALETARSAAWYAMYAVARNQPDAAIAASVAKASAGEAHAHVNDTALQAHGGIGFTWGHDLHFWLKRGLALAGAYGDAREHRARLAAHAFGED